MNIVSAQDTLTQAQMREDFNYMMEQYEHIHPNPTWSLGEESYSELKQQTLAQLDHPMTQLDFWRIIARWNQHFDGHTHVGWPTIPPMPAGMIAFPPKSIVQYRNNKLFFSAYEAMPDSLQGCEILAINGHPSAEIIDSIMPYVSHESEAHINNVILRSLYWFYQAFYGYSSQMEFLYRTTDGEKTVLLDRRALYTWLVQVGDSGKLYFIQSQFTYSAAILLAILAKQYRLGPVIGEETGGLTTTFTRHNSIMLPNSGLTFYCSDKQFHHFGTTGSRGVLPDISLEIGYKYLFRSFTAEELQKMITMSNQRDKQQ